MSRNVNWVSRFLFVCLFIVCLFVCLFVGDTLLLGRICVLKFYNPQQRKSFSELQPAVEEFSDPEDSLLSDR